MVIFFPQIYSSRAKKGNPRESRCCLCMCVVCVCVCVCVCKFALLNIGFQTMPEKRQSWEGMSAHSVSCSESSLQFHSCLGFTLCLMNKTKNIANSRGVWKSLNIPAMKAGEKNLLKSLDLEKILLFKRIDCTWSIQSRYIKYLWKYWCS
jgi:hypothetical protein